MSSLLDQLKGGDRRSIGAVPEVVKQVMEDPSLFEVVFDGMNNTDPLIRMRCADAVEKVTVHHPEFLGPYKRRLIKLADGAQQQEVRWHLAQLLSRLKINGPERRIVFGILSHYLTDDSLIVKTFSMQGLADIAFEDAKLRGPILSQLEFLTNTGSPAMKARGRILLARLKGSASHPKNHNGEKV